MREAHADTLASGPAADTLSLTQFVDDAAGLNSPTAAEFLPDGRLIIIEVGGRIKVRLTNGTIVDAGVVPVDLAGERGLLGLAIDPLFDTTHRLYFYYSQAGAPSTNRHRVAYAVFDPNTNQVDVAGRVDILSGLYGPNNHNGGGLAFGPDGYLYVGVGDTGCNCSCGPGEGDNYFATCLTNKNGKILRIDREGGIPSSNPLTMETAVVACGTTVTCGSSGQHQVPSDAVLSAPAKEIYNWGFRNPWRFSFDPLTGNLWIGDVGEVTYEEITISHGPGEHHGWPYREGQAGLAASKCNDVTHRGACVDPVYTYSHNGGQASVTGGVFSSDCIWPAAWKDVYWFGDYITNRIWTLTPNASRNGVVGDRQNVVSSARGPVHFFNGPDGGLYYVNITSSTIWRIAPSVPAACDGADAGPSTDAAGSTDATGATDAAGTTDAADATDASSMADASGTTDATAPSDAGLDGGTETDGGDPNTENVYLSVTALPIPATGERPHVAMELKAMNGAITLNSMMVSLDFTNAERGTGIEGFELREDLDGNTLVDASDPILASIDDVGLPGRPYTLVFSDETLALGASKRYLLTAKIVTISVPLGSHTPLVSHRWAPAWNAESGPPVLISLALAFALGAFGIWLCTRAPRLVLSAIIVAGIATAAGSCSDDKRTDALVTLHVTEIRAEQESTGATVNVEGLPISSDPILLD